MAWVYNGFSSYRLLAGGDQAAARLHAGLAEAARRLLARLWLTSANDVRDSEYRRLPGSLFDARYKGLTAHAARLDAAICRRENLR
jgi:hypothetical protein